VSKFLLSSSVNELADIGRPKFLPPLQKWWTFNSFQYEK